MMKIGVFSFAHAYSPACVLRITGEDAAIFLQGQFTNDLSKIGSGSGIYGLWLDRKGKVIGDSHVIKARDGKGFWIVSQNSPGAVIAKHLGDHIIADEVEIADETAGWRGIAIVGAGSGDWLSGTGRDGLIFPGRRTSQENWERLIPVSDADAALALLSGTPVATKEDLERMRILAGIPAVPADIGPSDLPNEGGLDRDAISYSKGCYLGQEVMARIKSLGRVRRTLVRVSGSGAPPAVPAALWQGDRREGELRSAVAVDSGFAGLALVSVTSAAGGAPFAFASGGGPGVSIAASA